MARKLVKKLKGRELELVMAAALQVQAAIERRAQVQAEGMVREQQFQALLELVTGEDTEDLVLDMETGEVFREIEDTPKRARKASSKRPSARRNKK